MIKLNTINGQLVYENVNEQTSEKFRYLLQLFNEDGNSLHPQKLEERLRLHPIASRLTARNFNKSYIVPVDSGSVLINFLPRKTTVRNSNYDYKVNPNFETFEPLEFRNELPDPFTLDDGTIFRVTGNGVKKLDEYTYYTMDNGELKQIPNWKTAQVLLNERGQLVESIRVVEPRQYNDLIRQSNVNSLVQNGMAVEEAEQVAAEIQTGKNPSFPIPPSANVQAPPSFTGPNSGGSANFPFALPPSGPTPSAGGFGAPPAGSPSAPVGPGGVSSGGGGGAGGFASGPNGSSTSAGIPAGGGGFGGGGSNGDPNNPSGPPGGAGGASGTIGGSNGWNPSDLSDPNNPSNPANQGGGGDDGSGDGPGGGDGSGAGSTFPDLSSEYTDDMEMLSMSEAFMQLSDTTGGQCQTMQTFQDSVDQTFDTMNNELDAMEAEADAAKAEADAAKTQAEAAVASSNAAATSADAAIAQANAAKAEADAAKEEAEALKAQLELELQQLQQQSQI